MAVIAAGTADLLNALRSQARGIVLSTAGSLDTFTIAHRLTNIGGKGASYYEFTAILRSCIASALNPPAVTVDSWNGSLVSLRLTGNIISAPVFAVVDVVGVDPSSLAW